MKTKIDCCRDCRDFEQQNQKFTNLLILVAALVVTVGLFMLFRLWK